jgi:two-component system, NarL family, nitrate/nitrite response regulator NarL
LTPSNLIRVAILEDHQSIIDGYLYRLGQATDIEVVAIATFTEELDRVLNKQKPDVLILDIFVQISPENPNFYPILQDIPRWLKKFPEMSILVISMHQTRSLVRAVMDAGASGYILKDDTSTIQELVSVIRSVAKGGVHLSNRVHKNLLTESPDDGLITTRQQQVLSLCAAYPDASTNELADKLGVAPSTLRNLLSTAYLRLEVHNRTAAITKARQLGLITPQDPSLL